MTDYDRTNLAAGYDRARDHGPEVLDLWMRTVAERVGDRSIREILDLGCGTGRFTEGLAARFNAAVVGLDPSSKMLQVARDKQRDARVRYLLGRAEEIPLPDASIDLVFMSMSLHHFVDPMAAAREINRVLSRDGCVVIRTATREQIPTYPYVPLIAATRSLLEQVLPGSWFGAAGLRVISATIVTQTIAPDWSVYADKLAAGGDSIMARLTDDEFAAGIAAVRHHALTSGQHPVVEEIDVFVLSRADRGDAPLRQMSRTPA